MTSDEDYEQLRKQARRGIDAGKQPPVCRAPSCEAGLGVHATVKVRGRRPKLPVEPEASFQRAVIELAHLHGWLVASFRKVRVQRASGEVYWETPVGADGTGWPDLALVRERVLYRELKSAKGTLTEEQREWREALLGAGQDWKVWRPAMWREIEAQLSPSYGR